MGFVSYDLGRELEPKAGSGQAQADRAWPTMMWLRVEHAPPFDLRLWSGGSFNLGALHSRTGQHAFQHAVERAIEYIRAGDIYQANLAHRLSAPFRGSARAFAARWLTRASPWYGAYLELPDHPEHGRRVIVSASPELFLHVDPLTRAITTRPMKGTRRAEASPDDLESSIKDQAELNMIVDLMRNDLSRVCEIPSVTVPSDRRLEMHGAPGSGGVWQATATVRGTLRKGVGPREILQAAFPGGSVTGAPKIRAMQIIDELEPVRRGPYCGCIGVIGDGGALELSIAIRTALITGRPGDTPGEIESGTLDYSVGAGIVADSRPEAEWRETLDKAATITSL
jgi:para-aminobenzoate synthetase component 1